MNIFGKLVMDKLVPQVQEFQKSKEDFETEQKMRKFLEKGINKHLHEA